MKNFIKVTRTDDTEGGEIFISKYQIVYMEADERHSQTYIYSTGKEFKVKEKISEILSQLAE
jgi:hypothetical protein